MVHLALEAAEALKDKISVKVINVASIKPLNEQAVIDAAKDCKAVVTAEEHSIRGGMGSAIAEALCKNPKPIEFVGMKDEFGCSAHNYKELLEHFDLTTDALIAAVEKMYNNY